MKLLLIRYVLPIASLLGALAALGFAGREQWDAVLTATVLGSVAWFVRMRLELMDLLPPPDRLKDRAEQENESKSS